MKTYAEFLRGYAGKKGVLIEPGAGHHSHWTFVIKKSSPDWGEVRLVDVGVDYAEFAVGNGFRFVPLNLLVFEAE